MQGAVLCQEVNIRSVKETDWGMYVLQGFYLFLCHICHAPIMSLEAPPTPQHKLLLHLWLCKVSLQVQATYGLALMNACQNDCQSDSQTFEL